MGSKILSVGEALRVGWEGLKRHFWLYFFFIVLFFAVNVGISYFIPCDPALVGAQQAAGMGAGCVVSTILSWLVNIFFLIGLINVSLKITRGEKPNFGDFFTKFGTCIKMIGAYIIYLIIVAVGLLLLVFPGVIWAVKFSLFPYMVVDKGAGWIESLKLSSRATDGAKWDLFAWYFVTIIVYMAGLFALGVGLFAAIPIVWIGMAFIYQKLIGEKS